MGCCIYLRKGQLYSGVFERIMLSFALVILFVFDPIMSRAQFIGEMKGYNYVLPAPIW